MVLESFIWCWIHLNPQHVIRRLATLFALAAMVLLPLFYINVDMVRAGFRLSSPSRNIQVAPDPPGGYLPAEE